MIKPMIGKNLGWRITVVVFILVCIGSVVYQTTAENREARTTACQTNINQEFLEIVKERSAISDARTTVIDNLIGSVFTAKTPQQATADYQTYLKELAIANEEDSKATYPTLGKCD